MLSWQVEHWRAIELASAEPPGFRIQMLCGMPIYQKPILMFDDVMCGDHLGVGGASEARTVHHAIIALVSEYCSRYRTSPLLSSLVLRSGKYGVRFYVPFEQLHYVVERKRRTNGTSTV
jgi:hypothetical protein